MALVWDVDGGHVGGLVCAQCGGRKESPAGNSRRQGLGVQNLLDCCWPSSFSLSHLFLPPLLHVSSS